MGEIHYMISEAAKNVGVESHVLRYWEEELNLPIERTEMGHRYYTEDNIQLFECIKKLKEEGVLLKELRLLIPEIIKAKAEFQLKKQAAHNRHKQEQKTRHQSKGNIEEILLKVLQENNGVLEQNVCDLVTESLKKEMSYLLDAKDQLEENRYKQLDSLIRQQQVNRKELARVGVNGRVKQLLGMPI